MRRTTGKPLPVHDQKAWKKQPKRHARMDSCGACGLCPGTSCEPAKVQNMRAYSGIRLTADGIDCSLPVTIDSHSLCSFQCAYCFSENGFGHVDSRAKSKERGVGQTQLHRVEAIFAGGGGQEGEKFRRALRYDKRNAQGYPCPIQVGGINDPCDNIERQQGWLLEFMKIAIKYNQPVRISTKGTVFQEPDYLRVLEQAPHLFWFSFSIISPDAKRLARIEKRAPPPEERIKTMRILSEIGAKTCLRFRPVIPGLSDATPDYPRAYRTLIEMAAEAGATSISTEVMYYPNNVPDKNKRAMAYMEKVVGVPIKQVYQELGSYGQRGSCMRPPHRWTENIMHAIRDVGHEHGMTVAVSDPVWKQLCDTGNCCGMPEDDPVFGNWEPRNATNTLLRARDDPNYVITLEDSVPEWAWEVKLMDLLMLGVGPTTVYKKRHLTWGEDIERVWHGNLRSPRSLLNYFQGAVRPVKLPDGKIGFKYVGLKRHHDERVPYWNVNG